MEFKKPPPRQKSEKQLKQDIMDNYELIVQESERQYDTFYPYTGQRRSKSLKAVELGIVNMLFRGAALLENGKITFWHPYEDRFVEYDAEYNKVLLRVLGELRNL